ncbi:MAG: T9SS type A sorting domain-containing protein [Bacteroidota bacterium]
MKRILSFVLLCGLFISQAGGQTIKTVGGSGANYTTLQAAFAAINTGTINGQIILQITGNTTETAAPVLYQSGYGGVSNYTSVTIYPTTTSIAISANTGTNFPVIDLNGADNVTIDGRVNQTGTPNSLTLTNTNTTSNAATLRFLNSAESNTIKYCIVKGAVYSSAQGIIAFSTANTGTGNNNNIVEYCNITNSITRPINAILFSGTTGRENTGNIIRNNNIYNFLNAGYSSYGINIASATNGCTISNNSFYDTETIAPTTNLLNYNVIKIGTTTQHTVSGNYIGGSASACGGTPWTVNSSFAHYFCAIYLTGSTGTATTIQGNTIANINYTSGEDNPWDGIFIFSGNVNVTGNTVGATSGTGSITVSCPVPMATTTMPGGGVVTAITVLNGGSGFTVAPAVTFSTSGSTTAATATATLGSGGSVLVTLNTGGVGYTSAPSVIFNGQSNTYSTSHGLINNSTGTVNITGNNFGSITTVGSDAYAHGFETIYIRTLAATTTLSNNLIGSITSANSIQASSTAVNSPINQNVYGIYSSSTLTTTISGNTIANLHNAYTGVQSGSRTRGIATIAGSNTIQNNTVRDISSASTQTSGSTSASVIGISATSATTGTTQTITGNTIYNLSNSTGTAKVFITGIFYSGPGTGTHTITGNFIHSLTLSTTSTISDIEGIELSSGAYTCANNIVSLGTGVGSGYIINGIWDAGNTAFTRNIYFNTVYIGGTVTSGTSNTAALRSAFNTATRDYRNNILDNVRGGGGTHYAASISGTTGLTIGYNDYMGALTGITLNTAPDNNSLAINPAFANAGGTAALDYYASAVLPAATGTGITTDYSGVTRGIPPKMGALEGNSYVWQGGTSTDFNTASNWTGNAVPPIGADISFASAPNNHCYLDADRSLKNIANANSGKNLVTNGHQLTITGSLTFSGSAYIDASASSSVVIFGGSSAQSIPTGIFLSNTVDGLTLNNTTGLTLNGNLTVAQTLTLTNGALTIGANTLSLNGSIVITSGSLTGGATSNISVVGSGASINLPAITLNNLTMNRANGITLTGSVSVGGTLALTSGTLTVGANTLTLSGNNPTSAGGVIDASNASSTMIFANASAITLPASFFSGAVTNLTLSGAGGVIAGSNLTVNGILNLAASNPSTTKGLLEMTIDYTGYPGTTNSSYLNSYILNMGSNATTIGTGDVTGIVKRGTIVANTPYTFGHQYTTIMLTSGTMPDAISLTITIGNTAPGTTNGSGFNYIKDGIKRTYEIVPTIPGGYTSTSTVAANFHYLSNELTSSISPYFVNTESKMVTWDYDIGGGFDADEHGRAAYDFTNKYIGLANIPISYFINIPGHEWRTVFTLRDFNAETYTWAGGSSTVWGTSTNWSPSGVPADVSHVIIPDASTTPNDPVLPSGVTINTLSIENGGVLIMGSETLTIKNSLSGGWEDQNPLGNDPGTSTVIFSQPGTTISGNARFYNVSISNGADITNQVNSTMRIGGTITKNSTGKWYADVNHATIEYNGAAQAVILPDGSPQYHNLILNGSGTKTMPASSLTLHNSLTVSGTASVTAGAAIAIPGSLSIGAGTSFATGAFNHTVGGSILCDGTLTSTTGTINCNGSSAQYIEGGGTATFYNLTVDNPVKVSIFNDALTTVTGTLLVNSGKKLEIAPGKFLTVSGTLSNSAGTAGLVIKSDETGTGSLIESSTGVSATVERYMTQDAWHLISAPISDALSGIFVDQYLRPFLESTNAFDPYIVSQTEPLTSGKGFVCWPVTSQAFNYTGTLNAGLVTRSLSWTDASHGNNLVGNPYPSSIDWNAVLGWTKTNVGPTIWVWNPTAGNYGTWDGENTTNGVSRYIPVGQGFFVQAIDATTLSMDNNVRVHNTSQAFLKSDPLPNSLKLHAENGTGSDEIVVCFNPSASSIYNPNMDSRKMFGEADSPQLYFYKPDDSEKLSIGILPTFINPIVVQVSLKSGVSGSYSITASEIESFDPKVSIVLEDVKLQEIQDLRVNPVYAFTADANENPDRFLLHFSNWPYGISDEDAPDPIRIYAHENTIYIRFESTLDAGGNLFIYDMFGRNVFHSVLTNASMQKVNPRLLKGYYIVKVISTQGVCTQKVFLN